MLRAPRCLPGAVTPGAETARRAEPGAGRGSSSPRCPPPPLLPDSVPGAELREGAGLQARFRPPPPPPPQTEDAPRRLEAGIFNFFFT
ncbi:formin-like protein 18 [Pipistrellus kuhlii]|uniref:formin-like protein 18 n=1 Tax=Pipistrellus kuhlii TaxID=59472 RepID=UPI001E2716CB|nr:formin-like protein 18 [Pipistrellus kuhlii]